MTLARAFIVQFHQDEHFPFHLETLKTEDLEFSSAL